MKPIDGLKKVGGKLPQDTKVMIGGKATPLYLDGSHGPFKCSRCEYFKEPSSCQKVSGTIDPDGCCDLFEEE